MPMVALLLSYNANVNAKDKAKYTAAPTIPISIAAACAHFDFDRPRFLCCIAVLAAPCDARRATCVLPQVNTAAIGRRQWARGGGRAAYLARRRCACDG
jgi:hypothetical protein